VFHLKGHAAPETKATAARARLLIEQAEALGEPPEDPLLLFSVLYGFWVASFVAFDGEGVRELAGQFLSLAEKQEATVLLMIGHRLMGASLLLTGDLAEGRAHFDQVAALYDPSEHRALALRFGVETGVSVLSYQSLALWVLGYPEAALAHSDHALKDARQIGQVATLMHVLARTLFPLIHCGAYAAGNALNELLALADEKASVFWKAWGMMHQGSALVLTGKASEAVNIITSGITAWRSTGATMLVPFFLSDLACAHGQLGKFDDAWRCISEAMAAVEATREKLWEAEVHRVAGEIALKSPEPDAARAQTYFQRALAVARQQQAKSWELRAVMSLARLWRSQGKGQQARELLAPVYSWFTEGFDTRDLKEAKVLLEELGAQAAERTGEFR
jgi:predicted ATPase